MAENTEGESWKPVTDWPEYQISSLGRVIGKHGRLLSTFPVQGYLAFNVIRDGRRLSLRVHREVLRAHVGDRPSLVVRHLNGNPLDCRLSNLEWGTSVENEADKDRHGTKLQGERHHQARLTLAAASYIKASTAKGTELAAQFGVTPTAICAIRRGRAWAGALR